MTKRERYFIWKIIFPLQELLSLISKQEKKVLYFDDEYSPLKDKIDNLCMQALHIFEQPEFKIEFGKMVRNSLNIKETAYHRIFSHGIKTKHGSVNDSNYSDTILKLPVTVYWFEKEKRYNYGYLPLLKVDYIDYDFFEDYFFVVYDLIQLFNLKINIQLAYDLKSPYYSVDNNNLLIEQYDNFKFVKKNMTNSTNIRLFKKENNNWIPSDHPNITYVVI